MHGWRVCRRAGAARLGQRRGQQRQTGAVGSAPGRRRHGTAEHTRPAIAGGVDVGARAALLVPSVAFCPCCKPWVHWAQPATH